MSTSTELEIAKPAVLARQAPTPIAVRDHVLKGKKFTVRKITEDTARVWRVK